MELSKPVYLRRQDAGQYQKSVKGRPSASRGLLQAHSSSHRQRLRICGRPLNKVSKRRRRFRNNSYKDAIIRIVEKREIVNPSLRTLMAVAISTNSPRPFQYLNSYSYIPTQSRLDEGWRYPSISLIPSTSTGSYQHASADARLGLKTSKLEKHAAHDYSSPLQRKNVEGSCTSLNTVGNTFASSRECPSPSTVEAVRRSGAISSETSAADTVNHCSEASSQHNFELNGGSINTSLTETSISIDDRPWLRETADIETYLHSRALPNIKEEDLAAPESGYAVSRPVERLMKDFRIHLEQNLMARGAEPKTPSSASSHAPTITASKQSSTRIQGRKRLASSHENEDISGDDDGDGDGRSSKRSRAGSEKPRLKQQFACPFRKHDPRKYSVQDWRTCALGSFTDISRVKGHLFRKHLVYQCQRCKESFKTESALEIHLRAEDACKLKNAEPVDGVTQKMEYQLRSRKKAYPGQTEPERWLQIYRILFPGEAVPPSPYFDPIWDNKESTRNSSETEDLANFQEYMREEIPRIVRKKIEDPAKLLENGMGGLRDKIIIIIREAQDQVFSKYRAMRASENPETVAPEPHYLGFEPQSRYLEYIDNGQHACVPEPFYGDNPQPEPNPWDLDDKIDDDYCVEYSDSYYGSLDPASKRFTEFLRHNAVNIESSVPSSKNHPRAYGQTKTSSTAISSREEPQPGRQEYSLKVTNTMEPPSKTKGPKLAPLQLPEPESATNRRDTDLTIKALITSQPEVLNDRPRETGISDRSSIS